MEQYRTVDDLLNKHDIKRAEILIAKSLRTDISTAERAKLLTARARARLMSARADEALDDLQQAHHLAPDMLATPNSLELLADVYFARFELASVGFADRSDTVQALQTYDHILADFPQYENLGWIHYQRGRLLLTENRVDEAVACFEQALQAPSTFPALTAYCYERLGFIAFYEQREPERALHDLQNAVVTYPEGEDRAWLVHIHTLRGRIFRELRDYDRAVDAANAALTAANPKAGLADALLSAAETLSLIDGHERDVIVHLQQYIQIAKHPLGIDVTWSRVHEMLGDAYYKSGQLPAAVAAYQAALEFNPYTPWELSLHYRIARTLYQIGDYTKSAQVIRTMLHAAEADGQTVGDYRVYNILGNAYFALGDYAEAVNAYQTAIDTAPTGAENLPKIRQYYQFAQELSRPV